MPHTPDAKTWSRGKELVSDEQEIVIELAVGEKAWVEDIPLPNGPYRWADIYFAAVLGVRALVISKRRVDESDERQGYDAFTVELYRYDEGEGPYYGGDLEVTIPWTCVGGSARDPQ